MLSNRPAKVKDLKKSILRLAFFLLLLLCIRNSSSAQGRVVINEFMSWSGCSTTSEYIELIPGELSVVVDEVHSYTVSVLGEVRNPGRFEFQNRATVLDALAEAGGLTEFASSDEILILRNEPEGIRRIVFDYEELMDDPRRNVELSIFPGDTVLVP